jgi:hypothetical protein
LKPIFATAAAILVFTLQAFGAFPRPGVGQGQSEIEHTAILSFSHGDKLKIEAVAKAGVDSMIFYFRHSGVTQWQARPMVKVNPAAFAFEFDTSVLPSNEMEYYLEAKRDGLKFTYPVSAPGQPVKASGTSPEPLPQVPENLPTPQEEEKKFKLPLGANGSLQGRIYEQEPQPGVKSTTASGNFRVFHTGRIVGSTTLKMDSNFSFTNTPIAGDKNVDLSNMIVGLTQGSHTLQAGDISLNESEYSVNGAGRRGVDYAFNNQKVYLHAFDISSQQPKGFKGFGLPKKEISVRGGAAGVSLFKNAVSVKAIYVSGKDNPFQGTNVGISPYAAARQGRVVALTEETRLFRNRLNFKAEIARSTYDGDLSDEIKETSDNALTLAAGFSLGPLTIGTVYRYVGKDFNSVGLQSLANDKKGLEASLVFAKGILNIQGSYMLQQDNVKNDPSKYTTHADNGSVNCSLSFSPKLSMVLGYRRTGQRTTLDEAETGGQDSLTDEFTGTFNLNLGSAAGLNITATKSNLSSQANPTSDSSALGLNLGCFLKAGEILTLNPTFGVSQSLNKATNEKSLTYTSLLAGEVYFIRRLCSLAIAGSFNRAELPTLGATNNLDLTSGLNFYLGRALKFTELVLSAKSQYQLNESSGQRNENYRIFFQGDISF